MTDRQSIILVVSALPGEQAALRRRRKLSADRLVNSGPSLWFGITGDSARRARDQLSSFVRNVRPNHIVAVGLGGALSPELRAGDIVNGARVAIRKSSRSEIRFETQSLTPWPARSIQEGLFVSHPKLVATSGEKNVLWEALGCPQPSLVDLESWSFAEVAHAADVPLSILRVVSDASDEDLPKEIIASANEHGAVQPWQVALRAAIRPLSWKKLITLKNRLDLAAERLADAFEEGIKARPDLNLGTN